MAMKCPLVARTSLGFWAIPSIILCVVHNQVAPWPQAMALPLGAEGEFFDMVTGLIVQLFNPGTTAAQTVNFGDGVAYVRADADATKLETLNAAGVPAGGLVAVPQGTTLDGDVFITIPNARIQEAHALPQSASAQPASVFAIVQLTQ
ncbi:hypothetical protein GNAINCEL_00037 [Serratia phage KKP 3709]|nr:hypothetical protein GNAINCEL_00037 [Serratia phage KKP 3709]